MISLPDTTFNIIPAKQAQSNLPTRVLFVGQKTSSGTATPGVVVSQIPNDGSESILFGANSMLAGMIRNAKAINGVTTFDAICLADNSAGSSATGTVTITGPATAAGTLSVAVGSSQNSTYAVGVNVGDTATTIATNLAALINADPNVMTTASSSAGVVTLTCDHKGTIGNTIGLELIGTPPTGVAVTLAAMSGGATDPILTSVFSGVSGIRYQTIVWPYNYGVATVVTELNTRFNESNAIRDGVAITCSTDTLSNLITAGNAQNSQSLVILGNKKVSASNLIGGGIFELDCVVAAEFAAVRALRLTDGANVSQYVISTNGARDSFGGVALSSLPYANTPFPLLPVTLPANSWLYSEWQQLQTAGISVLGNNDVNNAVVAGNIVTTYKTNAAGNQDLSFKFLNYVDTIVAAREYFWNNCRAQYAQSRLTQGDLVPNRNMANAQSITAFLAGLYLTLSGEDYVLLQAGEAARNYFLNNLSVDINMEAGSATIDCQVPIVTQLRQIIGTMQLSFSTQG